MVRSLWEDEVLTLVVTETHRDFVRFVVVGDERAVGANKFLEPGALLDMTTYTVERGFNAGWINPLGAGKQTVRAHLDAGSNVVLKLRT